MARRAAERQPARRGAVLLLVAATARETLADVLDLQWLRARDSSLAHANLSQIWPNLMQVVYFEASRCA